MKIERDVSDIRRMLEGSKMWVEHDEIYDESFIKVNILFIFFVISITFLLIRNISKKRFVGEIAKKSIKEKIYPNYTILKAAAARYCDKNYPELFEDWTERKWSLYYDSKIQTEVSFFFNI